MNAAETTTIVMQTLFAPTSSDPTGANALLDILVMAKTAQVWREFQDCDENGEVVRLWATKGAYPCLSFVKQLEAMPVHRRVGPCSKSQVTIYTPGQIVNNLSEVSCPRKQEEDRAKLRVPDVQIKSPRHQPQFQVGKWNIAIWYQTSWEGSNSSVTFRLITKMTFRALALCRHFPIR